MVVRLRSSRRQLQGIMVNEKTARYYISNRNCIDYIYVAIEKVERVLRPSYYANVQS